MANYKNQLTIYMTELEKITHKKGDNRNRYIQPIDFKYEAAAMRRLNGNAFKLWRYFLRWYGSTTYDFSPAAIMKELEIGKNAPYTAFEELERWGYLRQKEGTIRSYIFTPVLPVDYLELNDKNDF